MEQRQRTRWVIIGIAALIVLFLCTIGAAVAGGLAAFFVVQDQVEEASPELEARLDELERELGETQQQLGRMGEAFGDIQRQIEPGFPWQDIPLEDLPWENLPPGFPMQGMAGAVITEVLPGTPAEEAGLIPGDIILNVDDEPVTFERSLPELLAQFEPGDRVTLTVWRGGELTELPVRLGEHPDNPEQAYLGVRFTGMGFDQPQPQGP